MEFAFTDEQRMLREAVAGALARSPGDPGLAAAQGWTGIGVPEEGGGQGGGLVELAIVMEAIGGAASPVPLLASTGLALGLLAPGDLLASCARGSRRVVPLVSAAHIPLAVAVPATVPFVVEAPGADFFLLIEEEGVWAVDGSVEPVDLVDATRSVGHVTFDRAGAERVGEGGLGDLASRAAVLVAADALGASRRMLAMTRDYVLERRQFGVPVGSFQAVKHIAAEMLVDIEPAHSAVYHAAWAVDAGDPDAAMHASAAKALCTEAAARVADRALALHGAIGFTWEHELHVFYKRAKASTALFGSPREHLERVADGLALG